MIGAILLNSRPSEMGFALRCTNFTGQADTPQYHLPELRGPDGGIYTLFRQAERSEAQTGTYISSAILAEEKQ